jgi:tRNA(Ile)-lysidine synthase
MVHCNFGLRGEESSRDETFVRSLASRYNVPVMVEHFDTSAYAAAQKISIQQAARNLRYSWFQQLLAGGVYDYLLLAHHANDNVETTLMNFFRGTGIEGLTGMPFSIPHVKGIRPLLYKTREEISSFARQNELQWVEDSSNESVKYTRNFFRHEVLPLIKKVYNHADENVLHNIERFKGINAVYHWGVAQLKTKVCRTHKSEVHVLIALLWEYRHTSLVYEIIHEYGFHESHVQEVLRLCTGESGKYISSKNYQIIRHRNKLVISPVSVDTEMIAINSDVQQLSLFGQQVNLKTYAKDKWKLDTSAAVAQLDSREIEYPLIFRKWKTGDYFYPLGMRKKKKLSRFFIDQKLSRTDKEKLWIVESNKKIIWITGQRIDERFKVKPSTSKVLEISISSL